MLPNYSNFTFPKKVLRKNSNKNCCTLCIMARDSSGFNFSKNVSKKPVAKKMKTKPNGAKNVVNEIKHQIESSLTPKQKEQLLSNLLKSTQEVKYATAIKIQGTTEFSLSQTRGKSLRIALNPQQQTATQMSASDVAKIQTNLGISSNVVLGVANAIRGGVRKRKFFEPYLEQKLSALNHASDDYFDIREDEFVHVVGKKRRVEKQSFIFCNDVAELCRFVQNKRRHEEVDLKFGIDGGGGFLKICLSVQNGFDIEKGGRQSYIDGIAAKKFKDAGVKKLFLIGIAPSTQENYSNVSKLWSVLKICDLKGIVATDLKLANILTGLMTHSSSYPCTWCTAVNGKLDECGPYRTLGDCLLNLYNWLKSGGKLNHAKNYKNCINPPLFEGDDHDEIIDFLPPPELHLLIGIVNKLYDHMLLEFEHETLKWTKLCNVQRKINNGRLAFAGNGCKTLLNKIDILRSFCSLGCLKYVRCFTDFQRVVESCFSNDLKENFENHINEFKKSYLHLEISVTPKVHAVFFHVAHFCLKTAKGLGYFSEQAVESAHHDFHVTWSKYKVSNEHPEYGSRLLKAVREYNRRHL